MVRGHDLHVMQNLKFWIWTDGIICIDWHICTIVQKILYIDMIFNLMYPYGPYIVSVESPYSPEWNITQNRTSGYDNALMGELFHTSNSRKTPHTSHSRSWLFLRISENNGLIIGVAFVRHLNKAISVWPPQPVMLSNHHWLRMSNTDFRSHIPLLTHEGGLPLN